MTKMSLTRSFALGFLATTTLGCGLAHAKEPSLYFYPSAKWDVSSANKNDKGSPKCSISSEFNNGYIVQLSGDANNFTGINIDFREDTFEQGKNYEAKFTVPGVAEETLSAQATKKSLLSSNLQGHTALSKALIEASVLDLEIEGNAFRFYMTGLSAALQDYKQCAGEIPDEVALEDQGITPMPHQSADAASVDKKPQVITPLASTDDSSEKEISAKALLETPISHADESKNEVLAMKDEAPQADETMPEKDTSDGSPTSLQKKMAEMAAQDSGEPVKKQLFVKKVVAPNTSKFDPDAVQQRSSMSSTMKSPPIKINKEPPVKMEADFTKSGLGNEPKNDRDLPPIKEVRDIEPAATHPVDSNSIDMRNKIAELEKQILTMKDENAGLQEDLKQTLQDTRDERTSVSSENWNLERATMRFNESERQVERLGRQLQSQKTQCEMDKKDLEGMLFDPQVTNQQQLTKLSSLESELEKAKTDLLVQKRTYEERIKIMEGQLGKQ